MGNLARDFRSAWRSLRRSPGFAAAAILTLALGIGANTAIFTVVNAVLLEPLPFKDPSRLAFVWSDMTRAGYPRGPLSGPELGDLRDRTSRFDGFGAVWESVVNDFVARRGAGGLRISINDGGARPDTVALRLAQGVRLIEEPEA